MSTPFCYLYKPPTLLVFSGIKIRLFRISETADLYHLSAATAGAATATVIAAYDEDSENKEPNEIVTVKKIA